MSHHQTTKRRRTIDAFFKPESDAPSSSNVHTCIPDEHCHSEGQRVEHEEVDAQRVEPIEIHVQRIEPKEVNTTSLPRDPGLRLPTMQHPVNQRDEVRRTYLKMGAFKVWKKVSDGENCALLKHVGKTCSLHLSASNSCDVLMKPSQHINKMINAHSKEVVEKNRLRLNTTIDCVCWLAFQACAFRGHDESINSENRGNFIELLKYSATLNDKVHEVVLENAPGNAKYNSPLIQKELLHILANKVRKKIRAEIGNNKWCILVDESNKEQMAIVLRFVNDDGFVQERFFNIQRVEDTTALTLKKRISDILTCYNLHINNMRGQGYDGASNMRGAWNGLQALFRKDCPYAYYVHCFTHGLQLALVKASTTLGAIWEFFSMLSAIVNFVNSSSKRHAELQSAQEDGIIRKITTGEFETGRGANQNGNLQRAGATRWSSHYDYVSSVIRMLDASCTVIRGISKDNSNPSQGEAYNVYEEMRSFRFVFVLHLMNSIMGITEILCQALQQKSQDIVNVMNLVSTTKTLLQKLRQDDWNTFIESVDLFCKEQDYFYA